jgi:hypothetical protein
MSHFSDGQFVQLVGSLKAADWTPKDVTLLGQAGRDRLIGIRDSLRRGDNIIKAIVTGRTELWPHPRQEGGVQGRNILTYLIRTGLYDSCADLAELEAIEAKGLGFFLRYFKGKTVFGWRGVLREDVPCLSEFDGRLMLGWCYIGSVWYVDGLALRRK